MQNAIVTLTDHPELALIVATWRVKAFFDYPGGYTVDAMIETLLTPAPGRRETFILLHDGKPAGTAGLNPTDLQSRPDLTPWLVGVWVEPHLRHRGFASALIRRTEAYADAAEIPCLWLYTVDAEALYAGLGWQHAGIEQDYNRPVTLMRRPLPAPPRP